MEDEEEIKSGNDENTVKKLLKMDKAERSKVASAYALLSQIAIQVLVIMVAMFFLGKWLDEVFNTTPLFMLLLLLFGMASSFRSIYVIGMNEVNKFAKHDKSYKSYKKYDYKDEDDESDSF